jgi:hypothetical protein
MIKGDHFNPRNHCWNTALLEQIAAEHHHCTADATVGFSAALPMLPLLR